MSIKKYKQFLKTNEEFVHKKFDEVDDSKEVEEVDIFTQRINELADKLGVKADNNKVIYNGKEIIFPSETEMYHVDGKKFKTTEEVVDFLNK